MFASRMLGRANELPAVYRPGGSGPIEARGDYGALDDCSHGNLMPFGNTAI